MAAPAASSAPKPVFIYLSSVVDFAGNPDRAAGAMDELSKATALNPVKVS